MFNKKLKEQMDILEKEIEKSASDIKVIQRDYNEKIEKTNQEISENNRNIEGIQADISSKIEEIHSEIKKQSADLDNKINDYDKGTKNEITLLKSRLDVLYNLLNDFKTTGEKNLEKGLTDLKLFLENSLKHNFAVTEMLCKENTIELNKLKKEQEIFDKRLSESDNKLKLYIDGQLGTVREGIEKLNSRLTGLSQELSQKTGNISNEIYAIKDRISKTEINCQRIEDKIELTNREVPGLQEALKKNSDLVDKAFSDIKAMNNAINLSEKQVTFNINKNIEEKIIEYRQWINQEYYNAISGIIAIVKSLISNNPESDKALEDLKKTLEQKMLEEKWRKEKELKGEQIVNKGVLIIEKMEKLHADIIAREKRGENVDRLKEQLKAYNEIMEIIR